MLSCSADGAGVDVDAWVAGCFSAGRSKIVGGTTPHGNLTLCTAELTA